MSDSPKSAPYPRILQGTSLVDRMNIFIRFRKYFKLVAQRWWILVLGGAVGFGYASYQAKISPDLFKSTALMNVPGKLNLSNQKGPLLDEERSTYFENQVQFMSSAEVHAQVRERMGKRPPPPGKFTHEASHGTGSTFFMEVVSTDFGYAQQYAKLWPEEFLNFKNRRAEKIIGVTAVQLRQEVLQLEQQLDKERKAIEDFLNLHNIGSVKEIGDSAQQLLDRLINESSDISTLRKRLENQTKYDILNNLLDDKIQADEKGKKKGDKRAGETTSGAGAPEHFENSGEYLRLTLNLRRKEGELETFQATLKPKHPLMIKLAGELQKMQQDLQFLKELADKQREEQLGMIEKSRQDRIALLKKDEASYQPQIDEQRVLVVSSGKTLREYERLKESADRTKAELDSRRRNLEEVNRATGNEEPIQIIEAGVGEAIAFAPDRPKMRLNGLLYGLGVALLVIVVLHRLDDRLEMAEDIEAALEEPVLGQLPQQEVAMLKDGRLLITKLDAHNMFAESIRGVRSAVMFGAEGGKKQVILVSSAVPGDGKTTFTVNFAATLANAGNRVLLIDADLRRGNLHSYFDKAREPGMTDVLTGKLHWRDVVLDTEVNNLNLVTTGPLPPNPGELLISPVMQQFLAEARQNYDHILFDCPPLTGIDDTFCVVSLSDGLIFVIKAGQTSMVFAKNALALVRQRGTSIIGIVVNGITTDHPAYYYNYYYHAYYSDNQTKTIDPATSRPASKMAHRRSPGVRSNQAEARAPVGRPTTTGEASADQGPAPDFKARRTTQAAAGVRSGNQVPIESAQSDGNKPV